MTKGRPPKWPLLSLDFGQSHTVPLSDGPHPKISALLGALRKRRPEFTFTVKKKPEGFTITRVDPVAQPKPKEEPKSVSSDPDDVVHEDV